MIQLPHHIVVKVKHNVAELERRAQRERLLREVSLAVPLRLLLAKGLVAVARRLDPALCPQSRGRPSFGCCGDLEV